MTEKQLERIRQCVRDRMRGWNHINRTKGRPYGPCWPISHVLSVMGWGKVFFCRAIRVRTNRPYGHYLVVGKEHQVIDCSGEYLVSKSPAHAWYKEFEPFNDDWHYAYTEEQVAFWREALEEVARP